MKKTSPITIEKYLEETYPEAYEKVRRTWASCRFPGDAGETSPEFKHRREAQVRCRQVLLEDYEEGKFEVHGRHRDDPMSRFAVLDPDRQQEVLERWKYNPDSCPLGEVYLPDYGNMPVQLFRSRVWQDSTKFVRWAKEGLEEKYKAWEALIAAGKPQDRKLKAEILSELRNEKPELSQTGAAKAWKKADIPKWKARGFIKGRGRKPPRPMG